jgi:hypothetical protein
MDCTRANVCPARFPITTEPEACVDEPANVPIAILFILCPVSADEFPIAIEAVPCVFLPA